MKLDNIQDKHFLERKKITDSPTYALAKLLEKHGHWQIERFATETEDKEELVDIYVRFPDAPQKIQPIQFKIRTDARYKDFIISRYQPCFGLGKDEEIINKSSRNDQRTCNGRDWRGIVSGKSYRYYIATMKSKNVFDEISYCNSSKLKKRIQELDNEWETADQKNKFKFTREVIDKMKLRKERDLVFIHPKRNDVVRFQKNYNEHPKFLMFIDYQVRDGYFEIKDEMQNDIMKYVKEFTEIL